MNNQEYVCCICNKTFTGWGNNPYPVVDNPEARCCDACNDSIVVPARIANVYRKEKENG